MPSYLTLLIAVVSVSMLSACSTGSSQAGRSSEEEAGNIRMRRGDDAALAKAAQDARANWKEFETAYNAKNGESFFVKAPFKDGEEVEHMWIKVSAIDQKNVTGVLNNDPEMVHNIKIGDTVTILIDQTEDWMYRLNKELKGGYSIKVLQGQ